MVAPLDYRFDHPCVLFGRRGDRALVRGWSWRGTRGASTREGYAHRRPAVGRRSGSDPGCPGRGAVGPCGVRHFGTDHFGLRVADVDATVAELRRRGVTIDVEPWDFTPTLRIAFVKGPDDIRIELVQAKTVRSTSPREERRGSSDNGKDPGLVHHRLFERFRPCHRNTCARAGVARRGDGADPTQVAGLVHLVRNEDGPGPRRDRSGTGGRGRARCGGLLRGHRCSRQ